MSFWRVFNRRKQEAKKDPLFKGTLSEDAYRSLLKSPDGTDNVIVDEVVQKVFDYLNEANENGIKLVAPAQTYLYLHGDDVGNERDDAVKMESPSEWMIFSLNDQKIPAVTLSLSAIDSRKRDEVLCTEHIKPLLTHVEHRLLHQVATEFGKSIQRDEAEYLNISKDGSSYFLNMGANRSVSIARNLDEPHTGCMVMTEREGEKETRVMLDESASRKIEENLFLAREFHAWHEKAENRKKREIDMTLEQTSTPTPDASGITAMSILSTKPLPDIPQEMTDGQSSDGSFSAQIKQWWKNFKNVEHAPSSTKKAPPPRPKWASKQYPPVGRKASGTSPDPASQGKSVADCAPAGSSIQSVLVLHDLLRPREYRIVPCLDAKGNNPRRELQFYLPMRESENFSEYIHKQRLRAHLDRDALERRGEHFTTLLWHLKSQESGKAPVVEGYLMNSLYHPQYTKEAKIALRRLISYLGGPQSAQEPPFHEIKVPQQFRLLKGGVELDCGQRSMAYAHFMLDLEAKARKRGEPFVPPKELPYDKVVSYVRRYSSEKLVSTHIENGGEDFSRTLSAAAGGKKPIPEARKSTDDVSIKPVISHGSRVNRSSTNLAPTSHNTSQTPGR